MRANQKPWRPKVDARDYLHILVPIHLKERVRAVAATEWKNITQIVTEGLASYLAKNEPIHMRQAWEARQAKEAKTNGNGKANGNGAAVGRASTRAGVKEQPAQASSELDRVPLVEPG